MEKLVLVVFLCVVLSVQQVPAARYVPKWKKQVSRYYYTYIYFGFVINNATMVSSAVSLHKRTHWATYEEVYVGLVLLCV